MYDIARNANAPSATFMARSAEYNLPSRLIEIIEQVRTQDLGTKFGNYRERLNPDLSVHGMYSSRRYIPDCLRTSFSRVRLMSHSLKVETGRWSRTPREQRLCDRCDAGAVQDEEHALITCSFTQHLRRRHQNLNFTSMNALLEEEENLRDLAEYVHSVAQCM